MTQVKYLSRAPIREAVIDIRVRPKESFRAGAVREATTELATDYPILELSRLHAGLQIIGGKVSNIPQDISGEGITIRSHDQRNVAQFRPDGFAFSRLRPYLGWNSFSTEARRLWDFYAEHVEVDKLVRLAVRYINHFRVARSKVQNWLTVQIGLPAGEDPDRVISSLIQARLREPDGGIETRLSVALEAADPATELNVLLDIDCYRLGEFAPDAADFWPELEKLRVVKDRIFFATITDEAAREFI